MQIFRPTLCSEDWNKKPNYTHGTCSSRLKEQAHAITCRQASYDRRRIMVLELCVVFVLHHFIRPTPNQRAPQNRLREERDPFHVVAPQNRLREERDPLHVVVHPKMKRDFFVLSLLYSAPKLHTSLHTSTKLLPFRRASVGTWNLLDDNRSSTCAIPYTLNTCYHEGRPPQRVVYGHKPGPKRQYQWISCLVQDARPLHSRTQTWSY